MQNFRIVYGLQESVEKRVPKTNSETRRSSVSLFGWEIKNFEL